MPLVPISKLIDKSLYAKTTVEGYKQPDAKEVRYTFKPNGFIGTIYSWVKDTNTGDLYFMVYVTRSDYNNFIPTFIKIDSKKTYIPELPDILKQIEKEKEAEEIKNIKETKGLLGYYIEKYVPTVLMVVLGTYVVKSYIQTRNHAK